jgi:hypothetical protein
MYTRWILSKEGHWKINFDATCFQDVSYTFSPKKKSANLEFGYIFF